MDTNNVTSLTNQEGLLNISTQSGTGISFEPNVTAGSVDGLLAEYALIASPALTGVPTAPTPAVTNNTTQIATTAHVIANRAELQENINLKANSASPALTGVPTAPTPAVTNNTTQIATTAHVIANRAELQTNINLKANTDSPILKGIPTAPTPFTSDSSVQIATTAHVHANRAELQTNIDLKANITNVDASLNLKANITNVDASLNLKSDKSYVDASLNLKADESYVVDSLNLKANITYVDASLNLKSDIDSPAFTGIPTADTASAHVHTTQLATTEYVYNAINALIASAPGTLDTLNEIAMALEANENEVLALMVSSKITTDASLNLKADKSLVDSSFTQVDASFAQVDASFTHVNTSLNSKANKNLVDASLNLKADKSYVDSNILLIDASFTHVNTSLNSKANKNLIDASLNLKADKSYVDSNILLIDASLNLKADKSYVDSNILLIDASLNLKADKSYVDASLNLKVDRSLLEYVISNIDSSFNLKADKSYVDASLNLAMLRTDASLNSENNFTLRSKNGDIIIDASKNVFIGSNSTGVIMGEFNNALGAFTTNTSSPGFLTIGKSKRSRIAQSHGFLGASGSGIAQPQGESSVVYYSLVASERIACPEFNAFSDLRLKENIDEIQLNEAMNIVKNVKPVTFDWKENKQHTSGFIAQDIIKNDCPKHLVSVMQENGLDETIDSDNFISPKNQKFVVNYNGLIPYYHMVIKNLVERIELLESKV